MTDQLGKQQKLNVTEKHSEAQQDRLRQFLVNWVNDDLQPFSIVNSLTFRIFCNELDPAFLVPEDASKTSKYLNTITDFSARWYSSYLAWRHLIKLKGYIKGLLNHLELESDPDSLKDAKLLKNIMISDD
ncbi:hypothetical protein C1646_663893 [Rhizophagus diaphanus]|nr:hypothetical protein C1646_663893 [Rhizophagus diaphanus] [Rhizophagus sp. MUCL 43196]